MRSVLAIGAMVLGFGVASAAPDSEIPIGPGTVVYWTSAYDGGSSNFRENLIAQGDDFQLFVTEGEWAPGGLEDHFALFSGIYFAACDQRMPTAEERSDLAGLWPLTTGQQVEIATGDEATLKVGAATEVFLMGETRAAHIVNSVYRGDDPSEEDLLILDNTPLTVGVLWEDGTKDRATLVTKPNSVASMPVDTDLIGNCASLINNQTNKN